MYDDDYMEEGENEGGASFDIKKYVPLFVLLMVVGAAAFWFFVLRPVDVTISVSVKDAGGDEVGDAQIKVICVSGCSSDEMSSLEASDYFPGDPIVLKTKRTYTIKVESYDFGTKSTTLDLTDPATEKEAKKGGYVVSVSMVKKYKIDTEVKVEFNGEEVDSIFPGLEYDGYIVITNNGKKDEAIELEKIVEESKKKKGSRRKAPNFIKIKLLDKKKVIPRGESEKFKFTIYAEENDFDKYCKKGCEQNIGFKILKSTQKIESKINVVPKPEIRVTPQVLQFTITAGKAVTKDITIKNASRYSPINKRLKLSVGNVQGISTNIMSDIKFSFVPGDVIEKLDKGESKKVSLKVYVPATFKDDSVSGTITIKDDDEIFKQDIILKMNIKEIKTGLSISFTRSVSINEEEGGTFEAKPAELKITNNGDVTINKISVSTDCSDFISFPNQDTVEKLDPRGSISLAAVITVPATFTPDENPKTCVLSVQYDDPLNPNGPPIIKTQPVTIKVNFKND